MTTIVETTTTVTQRRTVAIPASVGIVLPGELSLPATAVGSVLFPHAGSSDLNPRNLEITEDLNAAGFATLALDLLTEEEAAERENVFDVYLLARRLAVATRWLRRQDVGALPLGYLGAGTAASAALWAATDPGFGVRAIVSLGGWPDLVRARLSRVQAPTLLIVGGVDSHVLELNRAALEELGSCEHELVVVPGATHCFEQFGALEQVDDLAVNWFRRHLSLDGME